MDKLEEVKAIDKLENVNNIKKIDIKSLNIRQLEEFVANLGEKKFRAKQIFQWLHQKNIIDFDGMTSLSKDFREKLKQNSYISYAKIVEKYVSAVDNTTKYLFEIRDGYIIESVLMRYEYGNSVCVSSQAGCKMGCRFCASTLNGLERNLTAGEIASQIYSISEDTGERVSNIVMMGTGEPLDNFDNVLNFIEIINSEMGVNIGQRHITVSTCGIVEKIYELADKDLQITLAVSLHAPNDERRKAIMPVALKYSVDTLLKACKYYTNTTKRRLTFEYALIAGQNDSKEEAEELASRIKGMLCHVNLIPINEVKERDYKKSNREAVEKFANILRGYGIETTVRRKLGSDINAACGQLRNSYMEKNEDKNIDENIDGIEESN